MFSLRLSNGFAKAIKSSIFRQETLMEDIKYETKRLPIS